MKVCRTCNRLQEFSSFYKSVYSRDGYYASCKKCRQKMVQRLRVEDKPARQAVVSRMKATGCCVCGEMDDVVLQLHHWPTPMTDLPWKRNGITETSRGIGEFIRNLAACVTICANCHLKEHAGRVTIDPSSSFSEDELYAWYIEAGGKKRLRRR